MSPSDITHAVDAPAPTGSRRVFVLGATGTAGGATVRALRLRGHEVVCFIRPGSTAGDAAARAARSSKLQGAEVRFGEVTDPASLAAEGLRGERFDTVVSCLASRTGAPQDAWAIDHRAHLHVLEAAQHARVGHFVLLSALCVQKPVLALQQNNLDFQAALIGSGMKYSIVRPTAFFKSLSGQIARVKRGEPFLIFGDGELTACKPISDDDLGRYLAGCLEDETRWDRVLPIGGPGEAITPRAQGEGLFALLGRPPRFRSAPVAMLDAIVRALSLTGRLSPFLAAKAELARIGRYYATESMLVLDPATGRYDAAATPSTGSQTLFDFYADVLAGAASPDRGDHAVFGRDAGRGKPPEERRPRTR